MTDKTYFRHGFLEVTDRLVKARGRSIRISTIESVELRRSVFFLAAALFGGLLLFSLTFIDLLYFSEIIVFAGVSALALAAAWNVATLTIFSKLTGARGWSVTWARPALVEMRGAIEKAISDRRRAGLKGGAVADDDEEEE